MCVGAGAEKVGVCFDVTFHVKTERVEKKKTHFGTRSQRKTYLQQYPPPPNPGPKFRPIALQLTANIGNRQATGLYYSVAQLQANVLW